MNLIEKADNIIEGWVNKWNEESLPPHQKLTAKNRMALCNTCENKKNILNLYFYCKGCGCKLPEKTFSFRDTNICPLNKW